jgi:hypothetical protein
MEPRWTPWPPSWLVGVGWRTPSERRRCSIPYPANSALSERPTRPWPPGGHPVPHIFDQLQAAQGYAALGEVEHARRLLDSAAERTAHGVRPPPPVYWYSEPFFQIDIGVAQLEIGAYADAAALLDAGLRGMPADQAGAEWLNEYRQALERARSLA